MTLIFSMQKSMEACCKFILTFLIGMVKHSQSSQNSKFSMSLQHLRKEVRNEFEFLDEGKHQSLLQLDFNTLSILRVLKVTSL